jgi:HEAT repeat protein
MEPGEIERLFTRALEGDYEDDLPWEAVKTLRLSGSRKVCDQALEWCSADDPLKRARGADVICQLRDSIVGEKSFPAEAYFVLTQMLANEREARPMASAIAGLGHLGYASTVPLICTFRSQREQDVRLNVASALSSFSSDPGSTATLIELTADADDDVRDWATFGLGRGDVDSVEVREALLNRLGDSHADTRAEAISGLARRKDLRLLPALFQLLSETEITMYAAESAELLLGIEEQPDWSGPEYMAALTEKFPSQMDSGEEFMIEGRVSSERDCGVSN